MSNSMCSVGNMTVYVKGSGSDSDIWDDTQLNIAYDKALKIAKDEVAKRIAMSTNTKDAASKNDKRKIEWKVGSPCRTVYEGDGQEYEAFIIQIMNERECLVKFLGYNNLEVVPISSLEPSLGKHECSKQVEQALAEQCDEEFADDVTMKERGSDRQPSPGSVDFHPKRKKSSRNKRPHNQTGAFEMPEMNMGNIPNFLRNMNMDMPLPPPPMFPTPSRVDNEDQAVSTMLISWYMSGYYTGLYQGMKRAREDQKTFRDTQKH